MQMTSRIKLQKLIKSLTDRKLLQEDLESVVRWASDNNMELNQKKLELLQHGNNFDLKLPFSLLSGQSMDSAVSVISGFLMIRD